jgi:hypothetical protein
MAPLAPNESAPNSQQLPLARSLIAVWGSPVTSRMLGSRMRTGIAIIMAEIPHGARLDQLLTANAPSETRSHERLEQLAG